MASSLVLTLILGARLRTVIFDFIKSPETKLGPINSLILIDQINSMFLATSIVMRITFILSPMAMHTVLGEEYCNVANFVGALYIGGSYVWSSYIALFRVLYIKAQNWLKLNIGIRNLLSLMIVAGIAQLVPFAFLLLLHDNENSTRKMCFHLSDSDLEIIDSYQVNNLQNNKCF